MTVDGRLKRLEDKIVCLEAIIDGSETQTREATAYIVGLVTRYLHEKGLIDGAALRAYVQAFGGHVADADDYIGGLVRQFASMLEFHERYPTEFILPQASPQDVL